MAYLEHIDNASDREIKLHRSFLRPTWNLQGDGVENPFAPWHAETFHPTSDFKRISGKYENQTSHVCENPAGRSIYRKISIGVATRGKRFRIYEIHVARVHYYSLGADTGSCGWASLGEPRKGLQRRNFSSQ